MAAGLHGKSCGDPAATWILVRCSYIHPGVSAGSDVAFARQVARGNITVNFNANLNVSLKGRADIAMALPSYVLAQPILGGQAAFALGVPYGRSRGEVDATLTGLGPLGFSVSGARTDAVSGFGDLAPLFSLRWNEGVNNYMTYVTGNVTIGRYDPARLANLGIGHNGIDAGAAYTYFNPQTGYEYSATLGFTYNFENTHTQYQNGIDAHLDLGASRFVTKRIQIGAVGYYFQQLSCDSGAADRVGCFRSRVAGIGPQLGFIFPVGEHYQGYFNVKGYKEFAAEHRADGWNAWLTLAFSPAAPTDTPLKAPLIRK